MVMPSRIILGTMDVQMVLLSCRCGAQIEVPLPILRQPFAGQDLSSADIPSVVLPCPFCKHLEVRGRESVLRVQVIDNPDLPDWYSGDVWLGCGAEGCESPLPLVYGWSVSTTAEEREADKDIWKWDRLRCRNGHAIQKPED